MAARLIYGLIFLLLISFPGSSFSQTGEKNSLEVDYRVVNWNYSNGLFYGRTTCFIKDVKGFLWIGTQNGLNRFDGSQFKNYLSSVNNKATIIGNTILSLVEDSLHNIWIGTDRGVSRYDCNADSFVSFLPEARALNSNHYIIPFWATKDELYCLESDSIFISYNIHTLVKRKWASLPGRAENNSAISLSIYEPKTNSVWLLPAGGKLRAKSGLFQFSLTDGSLVNHEWHCFKKIPEQDHWTEGICYDKKRNSIWLNTSDGLLQFNLNDKAFRAKYAFNEAEERGIGIQTDPQDRIWMCTERNGIIIFDPATSSVQIPFKGDQTKQAEVNNFNFRLYCDPQGTAWVGYWPQNPKGVNQLIPMSKSVIQYPPDSKNPKALSSTYGFQITNVDGKIWAFTIQGLDILDPATGSFSLIDGKKISGIPAGKDISFMNVGRTKDNCLFTINGVGNLFEMDIKTKVAMPIPVTDQNNQIISNIQLEEETIPFNYNKILIQEAGGSRIFILDKDSSMAHYFFSLPGKHVSRISTDTTETLFLKFKEDSLTATYKYVNKKLIRVHSPLDSIPWNNIVYSGATESWWVGGYGLLLQYNKEFRLIKKYERENGIPIINVWGIIPDKQGNIWFNTELYIGKLDISSGKITLLTEKDGWQQQGFKPGATVVATDNNDNLYFFGYNSLDRISPGQSSGNYPASLVYLKSVEINQKKYSSNTGINNLQELALDYSEDRISIETGIIDYYSKGNSQIRYKLGRSANWQFGLSNYVIHYEGLRPGNYMLIMQASNSAHDFNGPEKILNIYIRTPWWQTWWAYIVFGALIVFVIWIFIWYRSKSLKERNILLENKIQQRTSELHQSLEELKDTQTQLVQREKMASLGELTAGIAHEIQNPLNFVNNFSEVSNELVDELREVENSEPRDPELVNTLISDIDQNLKKITHHGKRADAIVKGMLQHSRISTGIKIPTDINSLLEDYVRLAYHGLRAKNNIFNVDIHKDLSEDSGKINIAPEEIGRVLLNLLNNAFYSVNEKKLALGDQYHPSMWVGTRRTTQLKSGNEIIEIRIKDNGLGIPEKIRNKIFQPFFTTKPTGEGTGLGLSLCYDTITKAYNGELLLESEPGEYAEFIVILPL